MGPTINSEGLKDRTKRFALMVIRLCRIVQPSQEGRIITRQLLRSATSVAANYRAVCRSRSRPDFISKLGIVPKNRMNHSSGLNSWQIQESFSPTRFTPC